MSDPQSPKLSAPALGSTSTHPPKAAGVGDSNDGAVPGGRIEPLLDPLPGEAGIADLSRPRPAEVSTKAKLAITAVVLSLVGMSGHALFRALAPTRAADEPGAKKTTDRPTAASGEPRKLDLTLPSPASSTLAGAPAASPSGNPRIPALIPTAEESAEPIGVRRTGAGGPGGSSSSKAPLPEDAPVLLVSSRSPPVTNTSASASSGPGQLPGQAPTGINAARDASSGANSDPNNDDPLQATTRNLQAYQRQLQGMLETLGRTTALASGQSGQSGQATSPNGSTGSALPALPAQVGMAGMAALAGAGAGAAQTTTPQPSASSGLFGGQLQASSTPKVSASRMGDLSLTLPKDTVLTCALTTKIISATSGLVGCQLLRNTYGADGHVLLLERGSRLDGEYRISSVKPGTVRIPVLWTRVRTPLGVEVPLESPGIGQLGESGVDGYVDNRWSERIGAALLLSLIDDSVQLLVRDQTQSSDSGTVVLSNTSSSTTKLAEKVLDSTINIPPLIYQNQAGIVGVYVARDIDFSTVYALRAVAP